MSIKKRLSDNPESRVGEDDGRKASGRSRFEDYEDEFER